MPAVLGTRRCYCPRSASRSATRSRRTAQFSLPSRFSASQLLRQRGLALSTTLLPQTLSMQFAENPLPVIRLRDEVAEMPNTHKPRVPVRGEVLGSKPVCATSKCYDCGRLGLQVVELLQQASDTFSHDMLICGQVAHQVARLLAHHPFDDVGHVGAVEGVTRHGEWARMGRETSGSAGMTGGACGAGVPGVRVGTTEWERPARLKFAA